MHFMNEYDISDAKRRHASHPVLRKATLFLERFKDEVNAHSDGWCYWRPPVRAANKLMTLVEDADATEAQFKAALTPIKSFYTRRGYAAGMVFPEVVECPRCGKHNTRIETTDRKRLYCDDCGQVTWSYGIMGDPQ